MIGERIKERREAINLSQDELAKKLGYKSRSSINKMELGIQDVPQRKIKQIAKILGCSIEFLMEDDKQEAQNQFPENIIQIPAMKKVPIIGEIACGVPVYAQEQYGEMADLPDGIRADFALIAKGDSMSGARISDGDLVFCKSADIVENGKIAAVVIGDSATLKRFYRYEEKGLIILKAENPAYEDLIYSDAEMADVHVLGQAIAFQSLVN